MLTSQVQALELQLAREAESAGVEAQVDEFDAHLQQGERGGMPGGFAAGSWMLCCNAAAENVSLLALWPQRHMGYVRRADTGGRAPGSVCLVEPRMTPSLILLSAGRYGEAAWSLVRMHKTLAAELEQQQQGEQGVSQQPGLEALQAACDGCEARISQVGWVGGQERGGR